MMDATSGWSHRKTLKKAQSVGDASFGGTREMSTTEHTTRAREATAALKAAVRQGRENPEQVVKGVSKDFLDAHPEYILPLQQAVLSKGFTSSAGLAPYDLEAPSNLIYWFEVILRNRLARLPGKGTSHRMRTIDGISGSLTPKGGGGVIDISQTPEYTGAFGGSTATWPAQLPPNGSQDVKSINVPYNFLGLSEGLSFVAQWAGEQFEDITALANLVLMQEMQFGEEYLIIAGSGTALTRPTTVTGATRTPNSTETAISGETTDIYVWVTAANYFGETVGRESSPIAVSGSEVVDITITPGDAGAAQQYNVYVGTGTADPGRTAAFFYGSFGGTKITIQGALPTTGNVPPSADSGTSGTNRWEGLQSVLTGHSGSSVYPAGWQGGYVATGLQQTLSLSLLIPALEGLYAANNATAFRASPTDLLVHGQDAGNLSADIAKNGSGTNYQLKIDQNQMAGVIHGTAVSQVVNPSTRKLMDVVVHPGFLQGTAMLMQYTTPNAVRNANTFEMRMVQDLMSINWPLVDPTFRFSAFEYGTLVAQAPQYCGILQGLQVSTESGTTGTWS